MRVVRREDRLGVASAGDAPSFSISIIPWTEAFTRDRAPKIRRALGATWVLNNSTSWAFLADEGYSTPCSKSIPRSSGTLRVLGSNPGEDILVHPLCERWETARQSGTDDGRREGIRLERVWTSRSRLTERVREKRGIEEPRSGRWLWRWLWWERMCSR